MTKEDMLITFIEHNEERISPFNMMRLVETYGFTRTESVEIYRTATLGWSGKDEV